MLPNNSAMISASGALQNHQAKEEDNVVDEEVELHQTEPNHPPENVPDLLLSDDDYSLYSDESFDSRYFDFAEGFDEDFDDALTVQSIFDDDDYFASLHSEDDLFDSPD